MTIIAVKCYRGSVSFLVKNSFKFTDVFKEMPKKLFSK